MSVLHLCAIRIGEMCAVCARWKLFCAPETIHCEAVKQEGNRCAELLASTMCSSCFICTCFPSPIYDDQNTLLTIKRSCSYATLSVPLSVSFKQSHIIIRKLNHAAEVIVSKAVYIYQENLSILKDKVSFAALQID